MQKFQSNKYQLRKKIKKTQKYCQINVSEKWFRSGKKNDIPNWLAEERKNFR